MPHCATKAGGQAAAFPDVCQTPSPPDGSPKPIPYPNAADLGSTNAGLTTKVKVAGAKALMLTAKVSVSTGDEPGVGGGVVSGCFAGPCQFSGGSLKVRMEGQPVVMHGVPSRHNGDAIANAPGGVVASVAQAKVTVT